MATHEALAIACERAVAKIEQYIDISLPRVHRDREVLRKIQLEAIANALESQSIPQKYLDAEQLARKGATKDKIVNALLEDDN